MSEFFTSLLKGILSFSIATLVIVVEPSVVLADDLSDEAIQAELGLPSATLDNSVFVTATGVDPMKKEETVKGKEPTKPTLAAPGLPLMPTKK